MLRTADRTEPIDDRKPGLRHEVEVRSSACSFGLNRTPFHFCNEGLVLRQQRTRGFGFRQGRQLDRHVDLGLGGFIGVESSGRRLLQNLSNGSVELLGPLLVGEARVDFGFGAPTHDIVLVLAAFDVPDRDGVAIAVIGQLLDPVKLDGQVMTGVDAVCVMHSSVSLLASDRDSVPTNALAACDDVAILQRRLEPQHDYGIIRELPEAITESHRSDLFGRGDDESQRMLGSA